MASLWDIAKEAVFNPVQSFRRGAGIEESRPAPSRRRNTTLPPPPSAGLTAIPGGANFPSVPTLPGIPIPQIAGLPNVSLPGISPEFMSLVSAGSDAARRAINEQFQTAAAEIARREAGANQVLGQMPGQLRQQFGEGRGTLQDFAAQAGAQINAGAPVAIEDIGLTGQEGITPFAQAMTAMEASRQADVPVLGLASSQAYGGMRTAADMARLAEMAELARAEQEFGQALALERMRQQGQLSLAQLQEAAANARAQAGIAGDLIGTQYGAQTGLISDLFGAQTGLAAGQQELGFRAGLEQSLAQADPNAARFEQFRQQYPRATAEAMSLIHEGGDLRTWIAQGKDPGARRLRAELVSLLLGSSGG